MRVATADRYQLMVEQYTIPRIGSIKLTKLTVYDLQKLCKDLMLFATKKHREPKFSMLSGADRQIRTADLILTKDALYRLSYISMTAPKRGLL